MLEITCPAIKDPKYGMSSCSSSSTNHGDNCAIKCNGGFYLTAGPETVKCGTGIGVNGTWNDTAKHTCQRKLRYILRNVIAIYVTLD